MLIIKTKFLEFQSYKKNTSSDIFGKAVRCTKSLLCNFTMCSQFVKYTFRIYLMIMPYLLYQNQKNHLVSNSDKEPFIIT